MDDFQKLYLYQPFNIPFRIELMAKRPSFDGAILEEIDWDEINFHLPNGLLEEHHDALHKEARMIDRYSLISLCYPEVQSTLQVRSADMPGPGEYIEIEVRVL